jgi:hypothetical protein
MEDAVTPGWRVERTTRNHAVEIAHVAGVSPSALIDALVADAYRNFTDQGKGIPAWAPASLRPINELPIDTD